MKLSQRHFSLSAALISAALFAGCASQVNLEEEAAKKRAAEAAAAQAAANEAAAAKARAEQARIAAEQEAQRQAAAAKAAADAARAQEAARLAALADLEKRLVNVVYFDFDSFVIRDDAKPALADHAKFMGMKSQAKVMLEGHADERGSREYNLALGQKRAEAVGKSLGLLGVTEAQMEAVSYGEERPAVKGRGEEAWSKNRRVEFKAR